MIVALKFCFKTCIAMKFVVDNDDDDDDLTNRLWEFHDIYNSSAVGDTDEYYVLKLKG